MSKAQWACWLVLPQKASSDGVAALDDSAVGSLYSAPELGKRYGC